MNRLGRARKPTLTERIKNNPYGRMLIEGKDRVQVTKEEFIDLLHKSQSYIGDNGKFASVTYVKSAVDNIRKIRKGWDEDAVGQALADTEEYAGEDWHKGLTSFQNGEIKKNPVSQIIVAQRYTFHWLNDDAFDAKRNKWQDATDNNRLKHGLPLKFKDPTLTQAKFDSTTGMRHLETVNTDGLNGSAVFRFNMAGVVPSTTAYLVNDDGKIVTEIPGNIYRAIRRPHYSGPEKEAIEMLKDKPELLQSYADAKAEIDREFREKNLKSKQILCMAMSLGGTSYYFINDAIDVEIKKGGSKIDPSEWTAIAQKLIGETFIPLETGAFANESLRRGGKTIRLKESELRNAVNEAVKRVLSEGNAWNDQGPIDKFHPDWWYYRQEEEEPVTDWYDEAAEDDDISEERLRNAVTETIRRTLRRLRY